MTATAIVMPEISAVEMQWWWKKVKANHGGVSMTCGRVVVQAADPEEADRLITERAKTWEDEYVPRHAPLNGPYATEEEANGSPLA